MTFSSSKETMSNLQTLTVARVKEIMAANRAGRKVEQLQDADAVTERVEEPTYRSEEDSITRFDKAKRRKRNNRNKNDKGDRRNKPEGQAAASEQPKEQPKEQQKEAPKEAAQSVANEQGEHANRNNRNNRHFRPNNRRNHNGNRNGNRGEGKEQPTKNE